MSRLLAHEDAQRLTPRARQHALTDQAVIEHHVGLLQQLLRAQRQQIRIAGPGTDQIDLASQRSCRRCRILTAAN